MTCAWNYTHFSLFWLSDVLISPAERGFGSQVLKEICYVIFHTNAIFSKSFGIIHKKSFSLYCLCPHHITFDSFKELDEPSDFKAEVGEANIKRDITSVNEAEAMLAKAATAQALPDTLGMEGIVKESTLSKSDSGASSDAGKASRGEVKKGGAKVRKGGGRPLLHPFHVDGMQRVP